MVLPNPGSWQILGYISKWFLQKYLHKVKLLPSSIPPFPTVHSKNWSDIKDDQNQKDCSNKISNNSWAKQNVMLFRHFLCHFIFCMGNLWKLKSIFQTKSGVKLPEWQNSASKFANHFINLIISSKSYATQTNDPTDATYKARKSIVQIS